MPELPDIELYLASLERRVLGAPLDCLRLTSSFLLRTVEPAPAELAGRKVVSLARIGKRIVIGFEGELFAVLHLMIAGRLRWRPRGAAVPGRIRLAAFDFDRGTLLVTEAGTNGRAALHLVRGRAALAAHDPGGIEPLNSSPEAFAAALARENHTLKRALPDRRPGSGRPRALAPPGPGLAAVAGRIVGAGPYAPRIGAARHPGPTARRAASLRKAPAGDSLYGFFPEETLS